MNDKKTVTEVNSAADFITAPDPFTQEQLEREFDYHISQKMLKSLLDNGHITQGEFDKITAVNRRKFSPYLAEIMP